MRKLVPIFVVLLAVGLFWWTRGWSESPFPEVTDDVHACNENLREIYAGLREYKTRFGRVPEGSGVAFFGELIASGVWKNDRASVRKLSCPGPNAHPLTADTDFGDLATLTPASSAYAGRDQTKHPLTKFPSGGAELETLIACDNANGLNHTGVMNVLTSDGSVRTLELAQLVEQEKLPADATNVPVGPESPLEDLRVLAAD